MRIFLRCFLVLLAIWLIAAGAIYWIQSARPSPQKLMDFVKEHPLEGLSASKRAGVVDRTAILLNGLTFEQRRELKENGTIREFFAQLTADERRRFLALTVPEGFRQLIAALNRMDSVERGRLVQRTLRNVRRHGAEAGAIGGDEDLPRMISEGLSIFNEEATPEVKQAFAPVIAEIQQRQSTVHTGANGAQP